MNPAFRFARGGKVYKELEADEADEIPGFIRTGIISPNDDYWTPGMGDWKKVYSRQWDSPTPATSHTTTQAAEVAQSAASLAASVTPIIGRTLNCECTSCKKSFNTPAKAVSGYSVIGKAALFFILGMILLGVSWVIFIKWAIPAELSDAKVSFTVAMLVCILVALCGTGLLLMSLFELIAAAVTHGIYRASPERCPFCNSTTFTRKI